MRVFLATMALLCVAAVCFQAQTTLPDAPHPLASPPPVASPQPAAPTTNSGHNESGTPDIAKSNSGHSGAADAPAPLQPVKLTAIKWVTEKEARATGKPFLYHVTNSKTCPPCRRAKNLMASPVFIKATEKFACVLMDTTTYTKPETVASLKAWGDQMGVVNVPCDVFVSPDRKRTWTVNGCPGGSDPIALAGYLQRLQEGYDKVMGKSDVKVVPQSQQPALIPTLAAPKLPAMKETVEGPQRSVVVVRPRDPAGRNSSGRGPLTTSRPAPRYWTPSSAGIPQRPCPTCAPGFIGRATFRPQRLLR